MRVFFFIHAMVLFRILIGLCAVVTIAAQPKFIPGQTLTEDEETLVESHTVSLLQFVCFMSLTKHSDDETTALVRCISVASLGLRVSSLVHGWIVLLANTLVPQTACCHVVFANHKD